MLAVLAYLAVFGAGGALLYTGMRKGLDRRPVIKGETYQELKARARAERGGEVWVSPLAAPPSEPEKLGLWDFPVGRLASGALIVLLGLLFLAGVLHLPRDAKDTTTIVLPRSTVGLVATTAITPEDQRRVQDSLDGQGMSSFDMVGYGPPTQGAAQTVLVVAGRGNLPVGKVEPEPGDWIDSLLTGLGGAVVSIGGFGDFSPLGSGQHVSHGKAAQYALCWSIAASAKGIACEFWGSTFLVEVIDLRTTDMGEAAADAREIVDASVSVRGRHKAPKPGVSARGVRPRAAAH